MFWIIWIGLALVTAIAAQARGRSFAAWLALGVLFGIFALLAVLVMQPVAANQIEATRRARVTNHDPVPAPKPATPDDNLTTHRGYSIRISARGASCNGIQFESLSAAQSWVDRQLDSQHD